MKHAGQAALAELADLIESLRALPGLSERKTGIYYRKGLAFLHFHEDAAGLFADLRDGGAFTRFRVSTAAERKALLARARRAAAA